MEIRLPKGKHIYFASDNHLGAPTQAASRPREDKFVAWLHHIQKNAAALILVGDMFDFWFEYKTVVPKGFTRTLGKLAEIADSGIPIYYFVGNHDLWMDDYFETELGIPVFHKPQDFKITYPNNPKKEHLLFVGHGDGLGPGDTGYKRLKKVFTNPIFKWLFRWLHPDIGVRIAQYMSVKNKIISGDDDATFLGEDNEWLAIYSRKKLEQQHRDFFIFGHRHLPLTISLTPTSTYINLGDWIQYYTYGDFNGETLELKTWEYLKDS